MVLALVAVSGLLAALEPAQQLQVSSTLRRTVLLPFVSAHRAFAERANLSTSYRRLRAERDSLAAELLRSRTLAETGRQLRASSGLPGPADGEVSAVEIVPGRPRVGDSDVFVLRGGAVERVEPPAGVFTGSGLLGVMRAVQAGGGLGDFWTHPDFRVSVETSDGGISGILRPDRPEDGQPVMLLEGAPFQEEIPPGTVLRTTGIAGIFPPGVRVGTVRSVSGVESGWTRSYTVEPAVRPERADVALLWRRPPFPLRARAASGSDSAGAGPAPADVLPVRAAADTAGMLPERPGTGPGVSPADAAESEGSTDAADSAGSTDAAETPEAGGGG